MERLRQAGWQGVSAPLLAIRTLAPTLPRQPQGVLVTSANAVPALPAWLHGATVLAVGDRTADCARRAGFATVHSAAGDADDLAALVPQLFQRGAGALLLASGRGQGTALARHLRQAGFGVQRRAVYDAVAARRLPAAAAAALQGGLHAALFLSADTARVFVRLLPDALRPALSDVQALAIGDDAAAVLRGLPFAAVRVSLRPTLDGVLGLL